MELGEGKLGLKNEPASGLFGGLGKQYGGYAPLIVLLVLLLLGVVGFVIYKRVKKK